MMDNYEISVLMSVYKNDIPENIITAVESVVNQTYPAKEIIMIIDGPVSQDINNAITKLKNTYNILKVFALEKNVGLGNALNIGTNYCNYPLIARMDSDDICVRDRFEKQIECFKKDPLLSVVGSNAQEFFNDVKNLANIKAVPETHEQIVEFMKSRCPFCHMSVMLKKDILLKSGGYKDWYYAEDWYLWIRMYLSGAKFYNIQENLMLVRINYDTFERRGGLKYYKSIKNLLKYMKQNHIITNITYTKEKIRRFIGHVIIPKKLKNKLYMKYMRRSSNV